MAWQVRFLSHGTNLNVSQEPSSSQEVRTFLAYEDNPAYAGSGDTTWTIYALAKTSTAPWSLIPKVGERLYPGNADPNARQLLVDSVEVEAVAERANTWKIIVRSSAPLVGNNEYARVKLQYQQRNRIADIYIAPANSAAYPANGDAPTPPTSLITGAVVNVMGDPIRSPVVGAAITVETTYNPIADVAGGHWMTTFPATNDIINNCNRRNSVAWLDWPIGSVVFLSYEERELSQNTIQSSWNFLYDGAYHLEQMPFRRPTDGGLWLDTLYNWGGAGNQARGTSKAAWRQPYPADKINFNAPGVIFPQEVITALANTYPAW